jgi:dihydrodipicolinate synthase/N-acetylneuraminate lyase
LLAHIKGVTRAASFRRLLRQYTMQPIDDLILGTIAGEGLTVDEAEREHLVPIAVAERATIVRHRAGDACGRPFAVNVRPRVGQRIRAGRC